MSSEEQKFGELFESRNNHEKRIGKLEYQMNGNGDPSRGLMARMNMVEEDIKMLQGCVVTTESLKDHDDDLAKKIASDVVAQVREARDKKAIIRQRGMEAVIIALIGAAASIIVKVIGG